jgi:hypothetical protein
MKLINLTKDEVEAVREAVKFFRDEASHFTNKRGRGD